MSHTVYLALGTNLGNRMVNLTQALVLLIPFARLKQWSQVYETPPWGYLDQPAFLNMVVEIETELEPLELLDWLKLLEEKIGREKSFRFGPRLIDLDILFYDDLEIHTERLVIPHPRIAERAFVLVPLAELTPERKLRPGGHSISEILAQNDRSGIHPATAMDDHPPVEVALMATAHPEVLVHFSRQPTSHQREYLKAIIEAKKPATRRKRFEWMVAQLALKKE